MPDYSRRQILLGLPCLAATAASFPDISHAASRPDTSDDALNALRDLAERAWTSPSRGIRLSEREFVASAMSLQVVKELIDRRDAPRLRELALDQDLLVSIAGAAALGQAGLSLDRAISQFRTAISAYPRRPWPFSIDDMDSVMDVSSRLMRDAPGELWNEALNLLSWRQSSSLNLAGVFLSLSLCGRRLEAEFAAEPHPRGWANGAHVSVVAAGIASCRKDSIPCPRLDAALNELRLSSFLGQATFAAMAKGDNPHRDGLRRTITRELLVSMTSTGHEGYLALLANALWAE